MAAGLTLKSENLIAFKKAIEEAIISQVQGYIPKPTISYHMAISLNDLSPTMYKEFERIGPFGPCNEVPVFMADEVINAIPPRTVGHGGRHLKLVVQSTSNPSHRFEAIGFGMGERIRAHRASS